jgi:hypothetical protein
MAAQGQVFPGTHEVQYLQPICAHAPTHETTLKQHGSAKWWLFWCCCITFHASKHTTMPAWMLRCKLLTVYGPTGPVSASLVSGCAMGAGDRFCQNTQHARRIVGTCPFPPCRALRCVGGQAAQLLTRDSTSVTLWGLMLTAITVPGNVAHYMINGPRCAVLCCTCLSGHHGGAR